MPLPKSGRPTKITDEVLMKIDDAMSLDDKTTAKELVTALINIGVSISEFTALKARKLLGWTSRGTAYCQLIRAINREKRLLWAQENVGASYEGVIWSDETSVQMETYRCFCCRKKGQEPLLTRLPLPEMAQTHDKNSFTAHSSCDKLAATHVPIV